MATAARHAGALSAAAASRPAAAEEQRDAGTARHTRRRRRRRRSRDCVAGPRRQRHEPSRAGRGRAPTTEAIAAPPEPAYTPYKPKPSDFELSAKITDKECFGSAGCNVTFRVDVAYNGIQTLDDDATWLVVYEIYGVEDAPQVGNFELTGTKISGTEETMSTASSKKKITLKVTSVEQS
jgi:hypothetical protein